MQYDSLDDFLKSGTQALSKGPVAMIFAEDDVELASTLHHHIGLGFRTVLALMPDSFALPDDLAAQVHRIGFSYDPRVGVADTVNRVIRAAPKVWMYYCFNAEYLFFPFCESRTVGELLAFHAEERREAMLTYVIDLYADDLGQFPNAVSLEHAMLDRTGYYANAREDPKDWSKLDRQLDFSGGLRWRFEEHIPYTRRRIDRIALFRAKPGLELRPDHTFSEAEYNTYSCPWHHNLSAAICSFRTAKALMRNPGSSAAIRDFCWRNSQAFEWNSRQLLDLGLIEPGQWF